MSETSHVPARRRSPSARLRSLVVLFHATVSASACSFLYGLEDVQCHTSADCRALGFSNRECVVGICRVPPDAHLDAGIGAGGNVTLPGADASLGSAGAGAGTAEGTDSDAGGDASRVDADVPGIPLVSSTPASGAVQVDPATNLELVFGVVVAPLEGQLSVHRLSDDYVVESMAMDDPRVDFDAQTVVVDFDALLAGDTDYYVRISAGALGEPGGAVFDGLTDSSALRFHTSSVTPPGDVATGLRLWLDADHAASLQRESGAIAVWADRSGEGNVLRQTDVDARPTSSDGALAGKTTVSFDGNGARLTASRGLALASWDAFVVWRSPLSASAAGERVMLSNGGNWTLRHGGATSQSERSISRSVGDETATLQFGDPAANAPHVWNFTYDDAPRRLSTRTDGSGPATQPGLSASAGAPAGVFSLGATVDGSTPFTGELAEVIVYDRVLSASERDDVLLELDAKWGLTRTQCDGAEVPGPNERCYFLDTTARTWNSARFSCQQRGSGWNLTAIRSELDNYFATTLAGAAQVWIGGQDDQPQPEQFTWSVDQSAFWNGSAAGAPVNGRYVNWNPGEPNGGSDQADCVRLLDTGFWADFTCSAPDFGSICEGPSN